METNQAQCRVHCCKEGIQRLLLHHSNKADISFGHLQGEYFGHNYHKAFDLTLISPEQALLQKYQEQFRFAWFKGQPKVQTSKDGQVNCLSLCPGMLSRCSYVWSIFLGDSKVTDSI
jgi:hypothetical protein